MEVSVASRRRNLPLEHIVVVVVPVEFFHRRKEYLERLEIFRNLRIGERG